MRSNWPIEFLIVRLRRKSFSIIVRLAFFLQIISLNYTVINGISLKMKIYHDSICSGDYSPVKSRWKLRGVCLCKILLYRVTGRHRILTMDINLICSKYQ